MINGHEVGIAHLTLLDTAPPDLVGIAEDVGFDFIGVRLHPSTPGEERYPMGPGAPMLAETVARLRDSPVRVEDVEVLAVSPQTHVSEFTPVFESAAELGARYLNVVEGGCELAQFTDVFAAIVEAAKPYGLVAAVEPITYRGVNSIPKAVAVAIASPGGRVMLDALHLFRFGGTLAEVSAMPEGMLSYLQLCDAPKIPPTELPVPKSLPMNQAIYGSDLQIEARAMRLLPGEGGLPLTDLLKALPPGIEVSVETPSVELSARVGPSVFARRALEATRRVLESPDQQ